jgi:transcriptional regulator with PAS, ATPase and Fis domain
MSKGDDGDGAGAGVGGMASSAPVTEVIYDEAHCRGAVVALRVKGSTREIPLAKRRQWSVGARAGCDIVIEDAYVSGHHCVLERRGDGLFVLDRGSKNGTYVNGHEVEGAELRPGSVLTIGRTALIALAEAGRSQPTAFEQLRGSDPGFRAAIDNAIRAATADCSVLVIGETGTGKELVARAVHEASHRSAGPFVAVNCGAIPHELVGSELFGHERGSFTGAVSERDGCFLQADGGTLLLDELGELPLAQQPHLLRVLETRRVRRIGGVNERSVDVRVVAATNRIDGLGTPASPIRLDLYHRLAVVVVTLPPLRDRLADLDEIVPGILDELASVYGRRQISAVAWEAMRGYAWPGNVRELRQALTRAVALGGIELRIEDLFPAIGPPATVPGRGLRVRGTQPPPLPGGWPRTTASDLPPYQAAERDMIADALANHPSIRAAAEALGMPKSTLAEKAERYGLLDARRAKRRK